MVKVHRQSASRIRQPPSDRDSNAAVSSSSPSGMLAIFLLEEWNRSKNKGLLFLADGERRAEQIGALLHALAPSCGVMVLPRRDALPFDETGPSRAVSGRRSSVVRRLASPDAAPLLIATAESVSQLVADRSCWKDAVKHLRIGAPFVEAELRTFLEEAGYLLDEAVDTPGSALFHGQVVELYPAGSLRPVRIETDGVCIVGIRSFDPADPTATVELDELTLDSVLEIPKVSGLTDEPREPANLKLVSVFSYLPSATLVLDAGVEERGTIWLEQVEEQVGDDRKSASTQFIAASEWKPLMRNAKVLKRSASYDATPRFFESSSPARSLRRFLAALEGTPVLFTAATAGDLKVMDRRAGRSSLLCADFAEVKKRAGRERLSLLVDFDRGFVHRNASAKIAIVAASDLLGSRAAHWAPMVPPSSQKSDSPDQVAAGDVVVHFDRGVAILRGLETISVEGTVEREMVRLEFADKKTVLVPVEELASIWRYSSDPTEVRLDKADGSSWVKRRNVAGQQILETAAHLRRLIEDHASSDAPKIVPPVAEYERFVGRFQYSPTPDQAAAIEDVLRDLASGRPMDRIVCGDVGFGKTEVALRAAAAAVFSGRQVALAVPTTVLARQHTETFEKRFAPFGVEVGHLSRFASKREAAVIGRSLSDGRLKVVVGTHALGGKGIAFADLGLVIVDEEQRFGAADKAMLSTLQEGRSPPHDECDANTPHP